MKFSIVIPAHNSAGYIHRALESIKAQTYKDYELIVICDSCTDNTEQIAMEYGAVIESVNYHCDGLTRNRGIEIARGEWLLFMDDDDWWLHEYVLQQLNDMTDNYPVADVICFGFIFKGVGYAEPIRKSTGTNWPACWCKCYRREAIGGSRFSDAIDGTADMQFFKDVFTKDLRIINWNMPLYYYNYWRDDSISAKGTPDLRGSTDVL